MMDAVPSELYNLRFSGSREDCVVDCVRKSREGSLNRMEVSKFSTDVNNTAGGGGRDNPAIQFSLKCRGLQF